MSVKIFGITVGLPVVAVATYLIAKNLDKKPSKPKIVVPTTTIPTAVPTSVPTYSMDTIAPKGYDNMRKPLISPSAQKAIDDELARRAREKAEKERAEAARKAALEAGINPVDRVAITVDMNGFSDADGRALRPFLLTRDGYDMEWNISGWTPWRATYLPRNIPGSGVAMNATLVGANKKLQVWAYNKNTHSGTNASYDWERNTRGQQARQNIIEGGRATYTNPDGSKRNATNASLYFTADGSGKVRFLLEHQDTQVTNKYGQPIGTSNKMVVKHYYKCTGAYIFPADGSKTIYLRAN